MTYPLTRRLGEFVAGLDYDAIPEKARKIIRTGFTDCIGVMIAGSTEPGPQLLKSTLKPAGTESSLLFCEGRASALDAARINGTAAHALDFDDTALRGHPSSPMVPAILAEAEAIGASGRRMLTAYAAGYEVWAELLRRDPLQSYEGWHATGVMGAIGAAAACASLRGLDAHASATALALAASQGAGLVANFGTMTKSFHAGNAAHTGILSARLAEAGFTASTCTLEGPAGFLRTVPSHESRIDFDSEFNPAAWAILQNGLSIKKYPLCFAAHRCIDGMFDILTAQAIDPARVRKVIATTSQRAVFMLSHTEPRTVLQAKFSMQFAMAAALLARRVGLAEVSEAFVQRPDVQALMKKVEARGNERDDPAKPGYAIYDEVVVELESQPPISSGHITKVRGDLDLPIPREDLWSKFKGCVEASGKSLPAHELFEALMDLDHLPAPASLPGVAR